MSTERERWNTLNQLDMGYSLDSEEKNELVIEDVILDDDEFLKASEGLYNRTEYMLAKTELEMAYAVSDGPSELMIEKLINAKNNVIKYLKNNKNHSNTM